MSYKILIINPGSTSTKIGVFEDETLLFEETLRHTTEELAGFNMIVDQKDFRKKVILDVLAEKNFDIKTLDVCVGRGGMLKPIPMTFLRILRSVSRASMHQTLAVSSQERSVMSSEFLHTS